MGRKSDQELMLCEIRQEACSSLNAYQQARFDPRPFAQAIIYHRRLWSEMQRYCFSSYGFF